MFELLVRSRKFMIGTAIVLAIILFGIIGPMFTRDPLQLNPSHVAEPPSSEFILGTGDLGEDIFAQLCTGTRNSLMIGAIAGGFATLVAVLVGGIGPYKGGLPDETSNAFTNVVMVFPMLPLLIILAALFGGGNASMFLVATLIGLTSWPWAARCIRSQVLTLREREFINVARMSGTKDRKIVITEIMPNMLAYIIIVFVVSLSIAVLTEAGLSMIGLGPDPSSNVTLGTMLDFIGTGSTQIALPWNYWWAFIPPGLILTIFLVGVFIMQSGMDEVFNPRLRSV
jgi:peptide/nickel transport system permease protein